jgi:hypothetical protein
MALLQKAYLGATPLFRNTAWFEDDAALIVSEAINVTVTADTAAHTKGAWAQLIASTSANASFIFVQVSGIGISNTDTASLIDLATGASGSETAIASNIAVGSASTGMGVGVGGSLVAFPYKIPSGTRIAARLQSVVTGSKTATVNAYAINFGDYATAPTSVDVIGGDTATSKGIEFSGASGTWVQAVASTSRAYRGVCLVTSAHNSSLGNTRPLYEIGVGSAGNEVVFGTLNNFTDTSERLGVAAPYSILFGRNIPAGSRLAVRHNLAANPDRYGFNLIGIP